MLIIKDVKATKGLVACRGLAAPNSSRVQTPLKESNMKTTDNLEEDNGSYEAVALTQTWQIFEQLVKQVSEFWDQPAMTWLRRSGRVCAMKEGCELPCKTSYAESGIHLHMCDFKLSHWSPGINVIWESRPWLLSTTYIVYVHRRIHIQLRFSYGNDTESKGPKIQSQKTIPR